MAEQNKVLECCEFSKILSFLCLLLGIGAAVAYPYWYTFVVVGAIEFVVGSLFVRHNVIGHRLFFFLDDKNVLHIHKGDWWLSVPRIYRHNLVLELWFGGWFRKCRVCGHNTNSWKSVRILYGWNGFPHRICVRDKCDGAIIIPLAFEDKGWAIGQLTSLLLALENNTFVESVLIAANGEKEIRPIAGKVGTAG